MTFTFKGKFIIHIHQLRSLQNGGHALPFLVTQFFAFPKYRNWKEIVGKQFPRRYTSMEAWPWLPAWQYSIASELTSLLITLLLLIHKCCVLLESVCTVHKKWEVLTWMSPPPHTLYSNLLAKEQKKNRNWAKKLLTDVECGLYLWLFYQGTVPYV